MDQTRVGVDALLPVVARRLWQVPALCITCEPVRVLGTNVARKVLLALKMGVKKKKTPPFQAPFPNPPLQARSSPQRSDSPCHNNTLSPLPRADSREEGCCLDPIHEQRPLLPDLFRHFSPAEARSIGNEVGPDSFSESGGFLVTGLGAVPFKPENEKVMV